MPQRTELNQKGLTGSAGRDESSRVRKSPPEGGTSGLRTMATSIILMLDLSNNPDAAREWANQNLAQAEIRSIPKADLKWGSKTSALRQLRTMKPRVFAVFCPDLTTQSATSSIQIFGALAGARTVILADSFGRIIRCSRYWGLVVAPLALGLQLVVGYLLLAPVAWLFTIVLEALSPIIKSTASNYDGVNRPGAASDPASQTCQAVIGPSVQGAAPDLGQFPGSVLAQPAGVPRNGLYLLASPASASLAGGMATHVSGFTGGAVAQGHRFDFIGSSQLARIDPANEVHMVPLSTALSATRALFELWNSFVYTIGAVRIFRQHQRDLVGQASSLSSPTGRQREEANRWEFIYQRYNRFNCAGVLLSALSGLPLLLEYNGSEVWVGRNWDPIGMMVLLKRFERINQRRADLIVVVSTAESRSLRALGVPADRIVVNPNGVDTGEFHPGCGGQELRDEMGLADKIVVGFLGSFGPWHGTDVLARAAVLMGIDSGCHFLFIGAGDLKTQTESIFSDANCAAMASFVGRIPHASIPRYLDACDILVAPHVPMPDGSPFFGSPTKLFEYLAMARPVVASRLGQMSEILVDGENAILVEPGVPSQFAEAILRLARDEPLRQKLGANARAMVMANHTWRHNARRTFEALELWFDRHQPSTGPEVRSGGPSGA